MKSIFDSVSRQCSQTVTNSYSTSFSVATKLLAPSIRQDVYNIYGFVRFADEIVDTFHDYDKEKLFNDFEVEMYKAIEDKISLNPILNAFQETVHKYNIPAEMAKVDINIYDVSGRLVENLHNGIQSKGNHKIIWDASNFPSGIYFVNLKSKHFTETQKVILIK